MSLSCLSFIDVGGGEFVVILLLAIVLFGGDLPKVARSLGRVVGDLRRQAEGLTREFRDYEDPRPRLPRRDFSPSKAPEPVEIPPPPPSIAPPAAAEEPNTEPKGPAAGDASPSAENQPPSL